MIVPYALIPVFYLMHIAYCPYQHVGHIIMSHYRVML